MPLYVSIPAKQAEEELPEIIWLAAWREQRAWVSGTAEMIGAWALNSWNSQT